MSNAKGLGGDFVLPMPHEGQQQSLLILILYQGLATGPAHHSSIVTHQPGTNGVIQSYQTEPTKPNLLNQTLHIKPTKPNLRK